jgi:Dihydrouridine synthase (Dus)
VYTEELMDRSLYSTIREVQPNGLIDFRRDTTNLSNKTKRKMDSCGGGPSIMLRIDPGIEKGKLICQIGTGEPNLALQAALHVHRDVDAIDINMGCPKKFSVGGGMGSALLSDPERAGSIIRTLRQGMSYLHPGHTNIVQDSPYQGHAGDVGFLYSHDKCRGTSNWNSC